MDGIGLNDEPKTAMTGSPERYHSAYRFLPLLLFLLSFGFRWHFVNAGMFHHDEVLLARAVETSVDTKSLTGTFNGRYGSVILNLLLYLPYNLATGKGAGDVVPFTGILTGAFLVATVYLLVHGMTGSKLAAALSALFLNFNFLFLTTSTTGKENTPQLFFFLFGLHLFLSGAERGSRIRKVAGAASIAFSLAVHEAGIPLLPVGVLFVLLYHLDGKHGLRTIGSDIGLLLAVSAIPFVLYLGDVVLDQLTVRSSHTVGFAGVFSRILGIAWKDFRVSGGFPLLAMAAAGVVALVRKPSQLLPLALWFLLIFYYGNVTSYSPRYLMYPLFPVVILAGVGSESIVRHLKNPVSGMSAIAGIAIAVCGYGLVKGYPLIRFRSEYNGPVRMAEAVRAVTPPDAVVLTTDESVFVEYYAKRKVLVHPVKELAPNRSFVAEIRALALAGKTIYINDTALNYDDHGHFQRLIKENFRIVPVVEVQDEDYHEAELGFAIFPNGICRILPK